MRKDLVLRRECLELQRIAARIGNEKCRLLALLAFESYAGLDQKAGTFGLQMSRKFPPFLHVQYDTKMPHRNGLAIDPVDRFFPFTGLAQMRNDLVAEEVEIDPFGRGPALLAFQKIAIKRARFGKVANGKGEMESGAIGHRCADIRPDAACGARQAGEDSMLKQPAKSETTRRALLRIDGRHVAVTLQLNRRARRLIVKVHPSTGEVSVVAPSRRALDEALDFARTESDWIAKRLASVPRPVMPVFGARLPFRGEDHVIRKGEDGKMPVWIERTEDEKIIRVSGHSEHAPRRVTDFLKREARKMFEKRAADYAEMIGVKPKRIVVRDTASRWGSCSSTRQLSFSWRLILAPAFVLDYVVAHEVAHLREMNHAPRFWRLVESMVGNVSRPQAWLAQNGVSLHRYAPRVK